MKQPAYSKKVTRIVSIFLFLFLVAGGVVGFILQQQSTDQRGQASEVYQCTTYYYEAADCSGIASEFEVNKVRYTQDRSVGCTNSGMLGKKQYMQVECLPSF